MFHASDTALPPVHVLVVGTGMYVCGRGTRSFGTVLPALLEGRRQGRIASVSVVGTQASHLVELKAKMARMEQQTGLTMPVRCFPEGGATSSEAYREAIETLPRPGCAIISVPHHLHRAIAGEALMAGLHTLVVKPLTATVAEARELVALAAEQNLYGAVEFHKRFDRANLMLRDVVSCGAIGEPLYALVEYSQRRSVPSERFLAWVDKVNVFQYLGVHYVDVLAFATGARPVRVMAVGQKRWLVSHGIDAYDAIQAIIEWRLPDGGGFASTILTSWVDPEGTSAMSDQRVKLIGTLGRYESDQKRRGISIVTDAGTEEPNPDFTVAYGTRPGQVEFQGYGIDSIMQFLDDVVRINAGLLTPGALEGQRPTFREGVTSVAVAEAAGHSLAGEGRWVEIDALVASADRTR